MSDVNDLRLTTLKAFNVTLIIAINNIISWSIAVNWNLQFNLALSFAHLITVTSQTLFKKKTIAYFQL